MLRISTFTDDHGIRLELEGSLVGPWVRELRRVTRQLLLKAKTVRLDLDKLRYADPDGADLLRELANEVIQINCSPFIRQQLERGIDHDADSKCSAR
jgi:hypothetical protein